VKKEKGERKEQSSGQKTSLEDRNDRAIGKEKMCTKNHRWIRQITNHKEKQRFGQQTPV
jgi:hypothetical protein